MLKRWRLLAGSRSRRERMEIVRFLWNVSSVGDIENGRLNTFCMEMMLVVKVVFSGVQNVNLSKQ